MPEAEKNNYLFVDSEHSADHDYILPKLFSIVDQFKNEKNSKSIFDLGCGNGSVANSLSLRGFDVRGIDSSESALQQAHQAYPGLKLEVGSAYDDLKTRYGQFPMVISLEVVEHLFNPRIYAKRLFDLVEPGGIAVLSTPYHGYWKNLVMALTGTLDGHFTALWDYGHIKFWSVKTLSILLSESGFSGDFKFYFVGRVPCLAKSMIVVARKPKADK